MATLLFRHERHTARVTVVLSIYTATSTLELQTIRTVEQLIWFMLALFICVGGQRRQRVFNVLTLNAGLQMLLLCCEIARQLLKNSNLLMTVV